jgi:hypothetical protein
MAQKIYFDESGYTGNHLLDANQKFFAYASVVTDDNEAQIFVESLIRRYNIQTGELKGGSLVKHHKGRKAIDEIFNEFDGRILYTIANKKYALACKLFEYIFEPVIADISTLFYGCDFHKFISMALYSEFLSLGAGAEEIFKEFESLMREPSDEKLHALFAAALHPENSQIITKVREFTQEHRPTIKDELGSLDENSTGKWILDITGTSLHALLARWGTKYEVITAICDNSKPLLESSNFFEAMIGNEQRLFAGFGNDKKPITFNLSGPLEFRDSKTCHGIQLADAIAGAAIHVFSGGNDDHAKKWRVQLVRAAQLPIIPDSEEIDPKRPEVQRNMLILDELHRRSTAAQDILKDMDKFIYLVSRRLRLGMQQYQIE